MDNPDNWDFQGEEPRGTIGGTQMEAEEQLDKPGKKVNRKLLFGSIGAVLFTAATSIFTVLQITEDVEVITNASESPTELIVIDPKSEASAYELIGSGGIDCFLSNIKFYDNETWSDITEAKWREEDRTLDVEYSFTCLEGGKTFAVDVTNLLQSSPGDISVSVFSNQVAGGAFSIDVTVQNWERSYCESRSVSASAEGNESPAYFETEVAGFFEPRKGCDLVAIYNPVYLETAIDIDVQLSQRIDELARNTTPEGCHFIAAILNESELLPEDVNKPIVDYLNGNYQSWEMWAGYGPSPEDYFFDESLSAKLDFEPQWMYVCTGEGLDYSELTLGGFIYDGESGTYSRPQSNQFDVSFMPWLEEPYDAQIRFDFYNRDLELCDYVTGTMVTKTEFDTYYRYDETVSIPNFDRSGCPIILLAEFTGIPGGVSQ